MSWPGSPIGCPGRPCEGRRGGRRGRCFEALQHLRDLHVRRGTAGGATTHELPRNAIRAERCLRSHRNHLWGQGTEDDAAAADDDEEEEEEEDGGEDGITASGGSDCKISAMIVGND